MPTAALQYLHSPTNEPLKSTPSSVSLIPVPAAYSSPTASIADLWPPPLDPHSSASHPAVRASVVSRPLVPRIQSTSIAADLHFPPQKIPSIEPCQLRQPRSIRWDFCNALEVQHPLRSTAKSKITVSRPRHQNEAIYGILVGAAR